MNINYNEKQLFIGDNPIATEFFANGFISDMDEKFTPSVIESYIRGGMVSDSILNNVIAGNIHREGDLCTHDSTLVIDNGYAYIVYCGNDGEDKDNPASPTAKVIFAKVDLSDGTTTYQVICQSGQTSDGITFTAGSGAPNAIKVGGNIVILFTAKTGNGNSDYNICSCVYNISTGVVSNYAKCQWTKGEDSGYFSTEDLNEIFPSRSPMANYARSQMNAHIAAYTKDGVTTYYVGHGYGEYYYSSQAGYLVHEPYCTIWKTTDFVNFEYFADFEKFKEFDIYPVLEVPCEVDTNGNVYACARYGQNNVGIIQKLDSEGNMLDFGKIQDSGARSTFFKIGNDIYLASNTIDRARTKVVALNVFGKLNNSLVRYDFNHGLQYPSFYNDNGTFYVCRTAGSTSLVLSRVLFPTVTSDAIRNAVLGLFT